MPQGPGTYGKMRGRPKKMEDGGSAKRLMQYMADGGMMPMDPKVARGGMKVTDGGVMVKIMPMEDGGAVKEMNGGGKNPKKIKGASAVQRTSGPGFTKTKSGSVTKYNYDEEGKPGRFQQVAGKQGRVPAVTGRTFVADATTTGSDANKMSFTTIRPGLGGRVSTTITPDGQKVQQRGDKPMTAKQLSDKAASRKRTRIKKKLMDTVAAAERQGQSKQVRQEPTGQLGAVLPAQTARKENIEKAVRKGSKGLKALAAKNPKLKYVGKDGMKMPGGGHVFKKANEGTKVEGNPRAEAKGQVKLRQANIARLKKEKAGIQAGGSSTGAKALAGDDKFKSLVGLSNISSSAVSKLHAGYDALIAAEQKQLAGAMKAAKRPPMLKKGDMEKAMARAAKQ